jgi:hypothetical protein
MLRTNDPVVMKSARSFVREMAQRELGPEQIRNLQKRFKEPRFPLFGATVKKDKDFVWCVSVSKIQYTQVAQRASQRGRPKARRKLSDSRRFKIDEIQWAGASDLKRLATGDEVLQRVREGRRMFLYPLGQIVHREGFNEEGTRCEIIFLEVPKSKRRRTWRACKAHLTDVAGNYSIKRVAQKATIDKIRTMFGSAVPQQ